MVKKLTQLGMIAAFGAVVVAMAMVTGASAEDKKALSIGAVMKANHGKESGVQQKIAAAVKDGKWEDAQAAAKTLADNGADLGKSTPKKGDPKSWETLSKKYADNTKAVFDASEKKDATAVKAALKDVGGSCKECHTAHRGK